MLAASQCIYILMDVMDMCVCVFSGAGAQNIFELLAQFKRGDCDGTKVRLGRLQVTAVV